MSRPVHRRPTTLRPVLVVLGALALVLTALAGAAPVGAQAGATGDPVLRLVQQTAWVGPDGTYQVAVRADGLPASATVQGELYPRVRTRAALAAAFDDAQLGSRIFFTPERPVAEAQPAGDGTIVISFPVSAGAPAPEGGVQLDRTPGVYPFVVKVHDARGTTIASLTTALLRLGGTDQPTTATRLAVGVVVPITAEVTPGDDGQPTMDDDAAAGLAASIATVTARPDVPLTIDASPEALQLASGADSGAAAAVTALRARANRGLLTAPYAPIDTGAWVDDGLGTEMDAQYAAGDATLQALLTTRPNGSTAVLDPTVSPPALGRLAGMGVQSVVIPSAQLEPLSDRAQNSAFAELFDVEVGDGGVVRGAVGDDAAANRLAAGDDPVLAGHRALAELAVLQVAQTGTARGVAVRVPAATDQVALSTFLAGLADPTGAGAGTPGSAMVSPVTLADLFTATSVAEVTRNGRTGPLVRTYRADPPADLGRYPSALRDSRAALAGLRSLVPTAPTLTTPIDETILSSGSRTLDADGRLAVLGAADAEVAALSSEIVVSPEQVVTLTSSSGRVPLNLENRLQVPANVRIVLNSAKLDFPEGDVIEEVLAPAQTTMIELPVETRASGAFPLTVTISSADGSLPVATTKYTVRSTAISGVGLVLSIGAGLFLLLWWGRHFRTTRRARKLVASNHPALSATEPGDYAPPDPDSPLSDPELPQPDPELPQPDPELPQPDPELPQPDPDPLEGR